MSQTKEKKLLDAIEKWKGKAKEAEEEVRHLQVYLIWAVGGIVTVILLWMQKVTVLVWK